MKPKTHSEETGYLEMTNLDSLLALLAREIILRNYKSEHSFYGNPAIRGLCLVGRSGL